MSQNSVVYALRFTVDINIHELAKCTWPNVFLTYMWFRMRNNSLDRELQQIKQTKNQTNTEITLSQLIKIIASLCSLLVWPYLNDNIKKKKKKHKGGPL